METVICRYCGRSVGVVSVKGAQGHLRIVEAHGTCPATVLNTPSSVPKRQGHRKGYL